MSEDNGNGENEEYENGDGENGEYENGDGENGEYENGDEGGENGNGDAKVQFRREDGVEKDGYICFPVETEAVAEEENQRLEEAPPERYELATCPADPRYQQMNKTNWCYRMFVDYHRCRNLLGESGRPCDYFYNCYQSICPSAWHERWDDQLRAGTFPRDVNTELPPPKQPPCP